MGGFRHHGIRMAGIVGPTRMPAQIRGGGRGKVGWGPEAPNGGHGYPWHSARQSILLVQSLSDRLSFNYNCPVHTHHQTYLDHFLGPPILNNGAVSGSFEQKYQIAWEQPLVTSNGKFQPRISNLEVK